MDCATIYCPTDNGYYETFDMPQQVRPTEYVTEVGIRLRAARIATGLNQRQMADKLGVKRGTYNRWEMGDQLIDPYVAVRMAQRYRITMDYIYHGDESGLSEEFVKKIKI
jgi:transcriptional regulator with XRE-family HTH domain